jgi:hypothetical protein
MVRLVQSRRLQLAVHNYSLLPSARVTAPLGWLGWGQTPEVAGL